MPRLRFGLSQAAPQRQETFRTSGDRAMAHHNMRRLLLAGTAAAALGAGQAGAQELEGYYELDPIYFEARDPVSGAADRATSMYVSGLELERARTGDLKDVFAGIASVSVAA